MTKEKYFKADGTEADAAEALDTEGNVRDGYTLRVKMTVMDEDEPAAPPPGHRLGSMREQAEEAFKANTHGIAAFAPKAPEVQKAYEANNDRLANAWKSK
jgi:hypothetical protein